MIDDWLMSLVYAAWLTATTMPLGFMLGASCSPCCEKCGSSSLPRTDPADEGTWVPSGTWRGGGGVTWTYQANTGEDGETWFFWGSQNTSGTNLPSNWSVPISEWNNLCNWYSHKDTAPDNTTSLSFTKRASRLPPSNAVVHIYSNVTTGSTFAEPGSSPLITVKAAYVWGAATIANGIGVATPIEFTATGTAHNASHGMVLNDSSSIAFATTLNGGAVFNDSSVNGFAIVNDGAVFNHQSEDRGDVYGGGTFHDDSRLRSSPSATLPQILNVVNGGATFNDDSESVSGTVNDGATFNDNSVHGSTVNGGATFNNNSEMLFGALVNGGATFNDAACSKRYKGNYSPAPCTKVFVAHPTDLPTCNGTAGTGCSDPSLQCGCG